MDGRDLRAYWSVVRARTRSSYGEVGQRGLRDLVRAESALAGSTTGEARAAAHAVGEVRRGQTENVSTRRHFETVDLHNFQDVLMLESLRVNRAMVLDAFTGVWLRSARRGQACLPTTGGTSEKRMGTGRSCRPCN